MPQQKYILVNSSSILIIIINQKKHSNSKITDKVSFAYTSSNVYVHVSLLLFLRDSVYPCGDQ